MNKYIKELIIPIGPAGCGKSSYYKKFYSNYFLVCPDLIRFRILDSENTKIYFSYEIEPEVWNEAYQIYDEALNKNYNIFFDSTNLTLKYRYPLVAKALKKSYFIHIIYFKIPIEIILERNLQRERKVREEVIKEQYKNLEPPEEYEYDKLTIISQ